MLTVQPVAISLSFSLSVSSTFILFTAGASSSGWGDVILKACDGICLGSTKLFYYPDDREVVVMVKTLSLFETFCKDMNCHKANSSYNCNDEGSQRFESFGKFI